MKKQQQKITQVLDAKLVAYVVIDVASSEDDKLRMRELMNDETALPPQIFKGDTHLGVRRAFFRLIECVRWFMLTFVRCRALMFSRRLLKRKQ